MRLEACTSLEEVWEVAAGGEAGPEWHLTIRPWYTHMKIDLTRNISGMKFTVHNYLH